MGQDARGESAGPGPPPVLAAGPRHLLLALGWLCVGLGIAGLVLPLLPGVIFLIAAAWCFARSSLRFHRWLYDHPRLGPPVRQWHAYRVIPPRGKIAAVIGMAASLGYVSVYVAEGWVLPAALGLVMAACAAYVVSRPSRPPPPAASDRRQPGI